MGPGTHGTGRCAADALQEGSRPRIGMRLLTNRHLRREDGMALVLAIGFLATLSVVTTTMIAYTSANARTTAMSGNRTQLDLAAEGGINSALAVLSKPGANAYDKWLFCVDGTAATLPCKWTSTYGKVTATWWGELFSTSSSTYWRITSDATSLNPTGGGQRSLRRLQASIPVNPKWTQRLTNEAWNYIYATKSASALPTCDMTLQQSVVVASPLYVNGNLCLQNSAAVTRGPLVVKGRLTLNARANTVGTSTNRVVSAAIGNGCQWVWGGTLHIPCSGDADSVFVESGKLTSATESIVAPVPEWQKWYLNGSPGPYYPCATSSGTPPTFDSPVAASGTATDDQKLAYLNNNVAAVNLTPTSSYTCKNANGELSWNAATKVLTVAGTIYIDGSAYVQNGAVNEYNGQATLYLTGTFLMKNASLCGGLNAERTACDFTHWNPNSELICIVAGGNGGQVSSGSGIQLISATIEGALQATSAIDTDTTSIADGPMIGSTVNLGQSVSTSFPTVELVPAGMPSNPAVYGEVGTMSWG